MIEKHEKAGLPVKVANGPFKGRYFVVVDYFVRQYQGKDIGKLRKSQKTLLDPVESRGFKVDEEVVFGRLYPSMEFICLHDKELRTDIKVVEGVETQIEEAELPPNVESLEKKKTTKRGGSSGKKSLSKGDKTGSTPVTPAKKVKDAKKEEADAGDAGDDSGSSD